MSYILDALKKIEHEKSKKSGPSGRISISGDLFLERSRPAAKTGIWKIILLVVGVSLVTGAAIWFVLQKKGNRRVAVIRPVAPPVAPVAPVVPVAPAAPVPPPVLPQPASPPVQSQPVGVTTPPAAPKRIKAPPVKELPVKGGSLSRKQVKAPRPPVYQKQTVQTVPAPADIKLSGIAWQDDRAARRVVINGFLLREGAVISGAKITDIKADRVRFLSDSGQFELKLDAVLPAEVK